MHRKRLGLVLLISVIFVLSSCGGGGGSGDGGGSTRGGRDSANFGCDGSCSTQRLTTDEVARILQQAIYGAQVLGVAATISVVDRVGNVLAVYQMEGAAGLSTISGGGSDGLEGVPVPATLAAISKAGTGAYLSSQGNAFSSRTASQIVQENFNPQERNQPGGPLFGVQFSQLICSDINVLDPTFAGGIPSGNKLRAAGSIGPRPLPLGLSADPGGLPLYKLGDLVGGIGIEYDALYTADRVITDVDDNGEERIAMIAATGFEAPSERVGDNIFVGGKQLRFTDLSYDDFEPLPEALPALDPSRLVAVPLFCAATIREGVPFGTPASGVANVVKANSPAAILVNASGANRFPPIDGASLPGGIELKAREVDGLLESALLTAYRGRAAIRLPLDLGIRVSIWVVDTLGVPLGFIRTEDAPVFGIDVSLQKARSALLFSSPDAAELLNAARLRNAVGNFSDYVTPTRALLGENALSGAYAISDRAIGNIARPFLPDGINGNANGPLSLPFPGTGGPRTWSPFNDGLQLDVSFQRIVQPLGVPVNPPAAIPDTCADPVVFGRRLGNGLQIFPGSVPLYRNGTLIGAIGISGDGIDQDDSVAFFGASRQGLDLSGHTDIGDAILGFNAPPEIRSDKIPLNFEHLRLRYVNCPEGPKRDDNDQNICEGL